MTPLDWQAIARAAAARGQVAGCQVVYEPCTGSTNDDAKRLAEAGAPEGLVVLADEQTAGRGRAGKSRWVTPSRTSIALSLVLRPALPAAQLPALSMMAGIAACDGVRDACGLDCRLKWPNDIMAGHRKLGGILVETALSGAGAAYAVIGIGLNGNVPAASLGPLPDAAVPPTTLLDETGVPVNRESLVIALLEHLDHLYATVRHGHLDVIVNRYRTLLQTLGTRVRLLTGPAGTPIVDGFAEDVTPDGALVLRLPDGTCRTFAHGDVSLRGPEHA